MRPAVEYAIRMGYFKESLKIPFSLFLENIWDNTKNMVLAVNNYREKDNCLVVKVWDIANIDKKRKMPPCKKVIIPKEELFESEFIILNDYKTIEYFYEDYEYLVEPDGCNTQEWVEEEQEEYRYMLNKLFFSIGHQMNREEVLWRNFMNGHMNKSYNLFLKSAPIDIQQCIVQEGGSCKWSNWLSWRKRILDFSGKVAPELVFYEAYEKKLKQNKKYQESIINKKDEELKWSQILCHNVEHGDEMTFSVTT